MSSLSFSNSFDFRGKFSEELNEKVVGSKA